MKYTPDILLQRQRTAYVGLISSNINKELIEYHKKMNTAAVHQPAEESSIQSTPTRKRGRELS